MDMKIEYVIHKDERGGYWAEVPILPGCVTEGRTLAELEENVKDCFKSLVESYAKLPPGADPASLDGKDGTRSAFLSLRFATPTRRRPARRPARELALA